MDNNNSQAPAERHAQQRMIENLSQFVQLEQIVRGCSNTTQLKFVMLNDTRRMIAYNQAIFCTVDFRKKLTIDGVSGALQVDTTSPYLIWMDSILEWLVQEKQPTVQIVEVSELPDEIKAQLSLYPQWNNSSGMWMPLLNKHKKIIAGLWLWREKGAWQEAEQKVLQFLADAYSYSWEALILRQPLMQKFRSLLTKRQRFVIALVATAIMFIPVRQSVLAPAEIVSANATVISAPIDGTIRKFFVSPNQNVSSGAKIFAMDDTDLRNRHEAAIKSLAVIQADYERATQQAFGDQEVRKEITQLKAKVDEKQAEINYLKELLDRLVIKVDAAGVIMFKDQDDWIGKPVATGERIAILADPQQMEVRAWLPIADIIDLPEDTKIIIYLNIDPLNPIEATIKHVNYEASMTPENLFAYKLTAKFDPEELKKHNYMKLGLQGTAKIQGKRVSLFYYLMRKPISFIRQKLGI